MNKTRLIEQCKRLAYIHAEESKEIKQEDEKIYLTNDGANCMAQTLMNIIDRKRYISKLK